MARHSSTSTTTEWGTYLRLHRLRTMTAGGKWKGKWPMSQAEFAGWLSDKVGKNISAGTYIFWETGRRTPKADMQKMVRGALSKNAVDVA